MMCDDCLMLLMFGCLCVFAYVVEMCVVVCGVLCDVVWFVCVCCLSVVFACAVCL